jgi:DNA-binding transcriptional regulator YdaS (Cro superfamily)
VRKSRKKIIDPGLRLAVEKAGSRYKLARALQIGLPSVMRWKRVPTGRIIQIEKVLQIDRQLLRPDLYDR